MKIDVKKINKAIKQTKNEVWVGLLVLIIVVLGAILIIGSLVKPPSGGAVFYYKIEGKDAKLFYMVPDKKPEYLLTLPSEETEPGRYKVPKHSYLSHNREILIHFERAEEIPIGEVSEGFMAYRIIYRPKYVNLKDGFIKDIEIEQNIDSVSLVFSPSDEDIAWVLRVEESTVEELEETEKKREVWTSDSDGSNARHLATLEEKVILLQKWHGDHLYFWGIQGVGYYSVGKINVKTGKVEYVRPKYCSGDLANCQNFRFSSSGKLFLYEAGLEKEEEETVELFVESFDGEESWRILVNNYISDRLWLPDENGIIYTEQIVERKTGLREKIHLVNLRTKEDKEIYSGSYLSQLVSDSSGKYLYFLEKETDEKFNLKRLNIEKGDTEIVDSGEYNQLKVFSGL